MLAITGSTGAVGGRVARALADDLRTDFRLVVRDPSRAPDFDTDVRVCDYADHAAAVEALRGAEVLFMVSAAEAVDRRDQHRTFIRAAAESGVRHIVYTSFFGAAPDATFTLARDHYATEQRIRSSAMRHTFLRDNLYLDFIPGLSSTDGVIRGPAGDGRVAAVARDDIADVAVQVLVGEGHDGQAYDLTGAEAFTLAEAAEELSRVSGRLITFEDETLEEARESRRPSGAADFEIEGWVTSYAAIGAGDLEDVSDCVQRFLDRPPKRLGEWLRENPDSYRRLLHPAA